MSGYLDQLTATTDQWTAEEVQALIAALTRRRLLTSASAAALMAGLADSAKAQPATPVGEWSFTDDRGVTVTLPAPPQRIVAFIDCAASLWQFGIKPIALFGPMFDTDGNPALRVGEVDVEEIPSVGDLNGLDLELLVSAQPDLIITNMWSEGNLNLLDLGGGGTEQIEQIAPIIGVSMLNRTVTDLLARYEELAVALGASPELAMVDGAKAGYDSACQAVRDAVAANPDLTFIFGFRSTDQLWIADPTQWPDLSLLTSLGVTIAVPDEPHGDGNPFYAVSWERLGLYPADVFMSQLQGPGEGGGALWDQYPAVAADQVRGWGPDPYWLLYTYENYAQILTEFAATILNSKVVS